MPKISAYVGNGAIIPVDSASIKQAYRCPFTDSVFATKREYVQHLKMTRRDIHDNIHAKNREKIMHDLWNQPTFPDIIAWIESHQSFMKHNAIANEWRPPSKQLQKQAFKIRITYLDLRHLDRCSNTHCAPHDGHTNFMGDKDRDFGYPGWTGRIEFTIESKLDISASTVVSNMRIHTGTGGSTDGVHYGYQVTFFDSDWPVLAKRYNERKVFDILAERKRPDEVDVFIYGDTKYFRW